MRTPRASPANVFQGVITKRILEEKYQTLAELKRGWKPSKFKGFRPFLFLKITFPRHIKGLRIQHSIGAKFLDIILDISPRLDSLDSQAKRDCKKRL